MTRRALVPVVLACFSAACASAARKPRGPEVVLDRYLAPVSSAVLAKVPSCHSTGHCPEQAVKPETPTAAPTPETAAVAPETTTPTTTTTPPAEPPPPSIAEPPLPSIAEAPPAAPGPKPPVATTDTAEAEPPLAPELEAARGL